MNDFKVYLRDLRIERGYLYRFIQKSASEWLKEDLMVSIRAIDSEIDRYTQLIEKNQIKKLEKEYQMSIFDVNR